MAHLRLDTLTYTGLIRQAPTRSAKNDIFRHPVGTVSLGVSTWGFL